MDGEDCRGATQRTLVVLVMCSVGGTDFTEYGAAPGHDVRDPERTADLDKLATRDEDLMALGHRIEGQEQRAGCVVHHESVFGSGNLLQESATVIVAAPSGAGRKV